MTRKKKTQKENRKKPLANAFRKVKKHFTALGFTNRLAIYIIFLLTAGLAGGFYLAIMSIEQAYTGALACYTAAFAPIGTACSIVLSKIVHKSEVENSGANGEGIKYAMAKANNFTAEDVNSPAI